MEGNPMAKAVSNKQSGNQPQATKAALAASMFTVTKGNKYDIDQTYTHSTDDKGHYEDVRVKVTPTMQAMVEEVIKDLPEYRNIQDVFRDAVVHRLHYLTTKAPNPAASTLITHEMMLHDLHLQQVKLDMWAKTISTIKKVAEAYIEDGAITELGHLLSKYEGEYDDMDLPWGKHREMENLLNDLSDRHRRMRRRDY